MEVEFVVDDIKDIVWNPSSFENFAVPPAKKKHYRPRRSLHCPVHPIIRSTTL